MSEATNVESSEEKSRSETPKGVPEPTLVNKRPFPIMCAIAAQVNGRQLFLSNNISMAELHEDGGAENEGPHA